jgi:demethylmenaquinone methyltransferase/2-methoxy-6-polyprenyl-1,4-benzoquinol methylase
VELSGVRRGQSVLDLAAGTGDLSARFSGMVGAEGRVVMSDINPKMLSRGRARLLDGGKAGNLHYVIADAERLPFTDNTFDCISIGFGLRNVTDKARALGSMFHALKPGGRVVILEFSHPHAKALRAAYDLYSFRVLPLMGRLVAKDPDSYRYLAESIRMHPDQEALKNLMEEAGFERCDFHDLSGGIVAVHRGYKF